jgi:pimeloyl-ACP methyl ester carboxylesterase
MDASILDETDPGKRDQALDLYDPQAANQPPYDPGFLHRYRRAQVDRNRRITATVKQRLEDLRASGRDKDEWAFVVHGTMADPRWLDPTIDPNDRKPGWCYLGDPRVVNMSPVGLARFCTLRSWLSQWSHDDAQADGRRSAARITAPVLVISNTADDACTPDQGRSLFEAVGHDRKELHEVKGANHYYFGQPDKAREAVGLCTSWLERHGLFD